MSAPYNCSAVQVIIVSAHTEIYNTSIYNKYEYPFSYATNKMSSVADHEYHTCAHCAASLAGHGNPAFGLCGGCHRERYCGLACQLAFVPWP